MVSYGETFHVVVFCQGETETTDRHARRQEGLNHPIIPPHIILTSTCFGTQYSLSYFWPLWYHSRVCDSTETVEHYHQQAPSQCPTLRDSILKRLHWVEVKTSGTSTSSSFHIVFRFFSPLMQMNCHLEDVRRHNSAWMIHQHRWCVSVCASESVSHWCCMCPKVWVGSSSPVLNLPSAIHRALQRSHLSDSFPFVILFRQ